MGEINLAQELYDKLLSGDTQDFEILTHIQLRGKPTPTEIDVLILFYDGKLKSHVYEFLGCQVYDTRYIHAGRAERNDSKFEAIPNNFRRKKGITEFYIAPHNAIQVSPASLDEYGSVEKRINADAKKIQKNIKRYVGVYTPNFGWNGKKQISKDMSGALLYEIIEALNKNQHSICLKAS